jgi:2-oxoglutarate dehydrogenase E1 component
MAIEFRERFNRDVFVDLLGYRKYGHNESDEPRFTQPLLYKIIEKHPDPRAIYAEELLKNGLISAEDSLVLEAEIDKILEEAFSHSKTVEKAHITSFLSEEWQEIRRAENEDFIKSPPAGIDVDSIKKLAIQISTLPNDKKFFRKILRLFDERRKMIDGIGSIDWALAEQLAYASLLEDGYNIRISGQDVERGTFSHRHAVLTLEDSENKYVPLHHLQSKGRFEIFNSPLSEYGVLGFEYGYALTAPNTLNIWEAQFGDFSNGAQIIFDQFLSSAEDKWNVQNGLVIFLPHGYEGQGPEHSSARVERYLSLCAENNFQITNCTTPANFFHLIRRQLKRDIRVPLVVFTPKSLLRHPRCVSELEAFSETGFMELIDDYQADPEKIERVLMCTGKVYYDLLEEKELKGKDNVAIIRLEQIYPLPEKQLIALKEKYHLANRWLWVQEEPANMGVWSFLKLYFDAIDFKLVSRPASGSPATGSSKFHFIQQKKIVDKAFHQCQCPRLDIECRMVCIGNQWQTFAKEIAQQIK